MALFKDQENPLHKRIAALLVKAFVEVETSQFERRFAQIIPVLADELDSNHFKQVKLSFYLISVNILHYLLTIRCEGQ